GFAKYEKTDFPVQLSRTNSAVFILFAPTEKVTSVTRVAPPPLDLTTPQIEGTFDTKETTNVPTVTAGVPTVTASVSTATANVLTATVGLGVVNLALLQPGVTSSGGVGSGTGPAVGGQRPTNNNFTIEAWTTTVRAPPGRWQRFPTMRSPSSLPCRTCTAPSTDTPTAASSTRRS